MTRLVTRYCYHDAILLAASWLGDGDLALDIRLDGHWNGGAEATVRVTLRGVRDRAAVEGRLLALAASAPPDGRLADVVGIARSAAGAFLIDTTQGPLEVRADALTE